MPGLANYRSGLKLLSNYNNVENFSKEQFGYLGEPLIVSDSILDAIIVHHMNSNNTNYVKSAPQIPNGAPMADFIYEDVMLRAEEIVQRYLCGEDELLATRSQMSRMILKHLKKYHGLLKSTSKEAKLALNKERKRRMIFTNASSNLSLSNVSNMVTLKKEIEKKERELLRLNSTTNKNRGRKQQLNTILEQLKRRKKEVSNELKRVAPEKRSRAQIEALNDTGRTTYSSLLVNTYARLHSSTQNLISPVYQMKGAATSVFNYDEATTDYTCSSYPKITDSNTAHLVFSSHAFAPQLAPAPRPAAGAKNAARFNASQRQNQPKKHYFLLQCEDTRVVSTSASDFDEWKSDPRASKLVPFQGVVESLNRKQIPFRTVFGDRLVKRRLVLHSFVERLNAALYLNYTRNNTRSELHPLYNRFSGLFLENMNKEVNNNNGSNSIVSNEEKNKALKQKYGVFYIKDPTGGAGGRARLRKRGVFATLDPVRTVLTPDHVRKLVKDAKIPEAQFRKQDDGTYRVIASIEFAIPGSPTFASITDINDQWKKRSSSILFSLINKGKNRNIGNVNTSTDDLLWNQQLRSFGTSGAQEYWIQLVREMYDNRRVENMRSKLRIVNSKQKKNTPLKPQEVLTKFKDLGLGDNLGVTCYGYACNPRDPSAPWSTSYHRLGRSWFCSDINKDAFQLPFGCYSDKCAPPALPVSHPNYHSSNGGTEPSRIKGDLELVAVNNICTTVLQPEAKNGTQGRYGHIKTAYKGQRIGKMSPSEAFGVFTSIRQATGYDDDPTTSPYQIRWGITDSGAKMNPRITINKPHQYPSADVNFRIQIVTGPKLEYSVLMSRKTLNINKPVDGAFDNVLNAALNIPPDSKPKNKHENLSNNLLSKKNSENIYNVNKLKNQNVRHKELRKHLLGVSNEWNSSTLGPKKVTGLNLDYSKLKHMGAGLKRSSKDVQMDTETLDDNFMMLDGDIFTACGRKVDYLLHGGSERALGLSKKFVDGPTKPVIPLILPLNPGHGSYNQLKKRARIMFNNLLEDSTGGVAGLVQRQMENVCIPIFKSGSLLKGTHFNDLMDRFLSAVGDLQSKGENLELKLKSPKLYNIMKCIQFYLYLHVGLTTQEALTEIAKYQARRNTKAIQQDMFLLSTKLRLLGNTGPMPKKMFQKIVRQYLMTSKNNAYLQPEEVQSEIEELTNKLTSFKVFGRRFARQSFLPSFLGGVQKANKKMGIPSPGFNKNLKGSGTSFENLADSAKNPIRTIKKLTKPPVGQKEKAMIGSGGNNRAIKNTNIRMSPGSKVQQNARRRGANTARRVQNAMRPWNPSIRNRAYSPISFAKQFASQLAQ
uniref:Uncharacterized protein n=1 Tax=viral metagenome TaxID=1070528 RepID=A0A6C0IY56_9ZZZZ